MIKANRRQLLGLLASSALLVLAPGTTVVRSPSHGSALGATLMHGLRTGSRISVDGISLIVPAAGQGAWGTAIQMNGGRRLLGVETAPDGSVRVFRTHGASAKAGLSTGAPAAPESACSDGAYSLTGASWNKTVNWWYKGSSTPGEITQSDAIDALRDAMRNLTQANNDCGLSDKIWANSHYQGTTSKSANIGTDSSCKGSDGTNVVDFGNLAAADLGYVCWWTSGKKTVSSDARLNSSEYSWAVNLNGCVSKYSVEDVATHEFGHTFGLNDLAEGLHPALTMSLIMLPCQNAETTLGLGDIKGLEAIY